MACGKLNLLLLKLKALKQSNIKEVVSNRINEFENVSEAKKIFNELCFCILTANYSAEKAIKIQHHLAEDFHTLTQKELAEKLRALGYRYPNTRASYIVEARKYKKELLQRLNFNNEIELREWLVKHIKGVGYKEASHFLRNVGYKNVAIIDFHILDLLKRYGLIKKIKRLNKTMYLEIEQILNKIATRIDVSLAELDLYLWYIETGKVLK